MANKRTRIDGHPARCVELAAPLGQDRGPGTTGPLDARAIGPNLLAFALGQLRDARAHLSGGGDDPHAGIHQARKCIRRTRATLALGARVFDRRAARLDDELRRLCRGMAGLRDAQALVDELQRLEGSAPAGLQALLPQAQTAARERRDRMLEQALQRDPGLATRRQRLLAAQARLALLPWQAVGEDDVAAATTRSRRRVDKARARAQRHPDQERRWHLYRRRLRRLHQQDTLLAGSWPGLRPSTGGLDDHAALGESQDDALLLRRCGKGSPFPPGQTRRALRHIARERLQRARAGFATAWHAARPTAGVAQASSSVAISPSAARRRRASARASAANTP